MASGPICHFMGNRWGNSGNSDKLYFGGLQNHCKVTAAMKLKDTLWKKSYDQPRQHTKIRDILMSLMTLMTFNGPKKDPSSQSFVFSSSHVWMWELDHKESWDSKNWCFWTVVVKTLESPLDYKETKPVHPKGNQSWIFIGRTDAKAETPILWPPNARNWLIGKDSVAGKDWRWKEKGTTED